MTALIPPEALEGLMHKVFVDKSVAPGLFWDALLKSNLFVPLADKAKSSLNQITVNVDAKESNLLLGVDADGQHVVWLFTSQAVLIDYTEQDLPTLEVPAPKLFKQIKLCENDVVLIGPNGVTLNLHQALVTSLGDEKVPELPEEGVRNIPKDTEVFVGKAPEDAAPLEKAFAELFQGIPEVLEGCFIQVSDDAGPRLLLGLRLSQETRQGLRVVAEKVAHVAEGLLDRGKTMDITLINGSLKEAFEKWGKPFFKR